MKILHVKNLLLGIAALACVYGSVWAAKAITDESVVKIGDYIVVNGEMSFAVKVGDETVARKTVKNLVEVRSTMDDGNWTKPSDGEIDFKNGRVIVTPNKGGTSGFARVKIPATDDARRRD